MNVYDEAHALARALKQSGEYQEYMALKQSAYEDSTNRALLEEFKRLQFQTQVKMAGGSRPDDEDMERLTKIGSLLQFNPDTSRYLLAEMRFQKMLADVYKILGDAAGLDLDLLQG